MASLPHQRPNVQRRQSPTSADSASSQHEHPHRTESISAASVDSQTLLLNSPPSRSSKPAEQEQKATQTQPEATQPDEEPRKCWICFSDETEDDPTSSAWRSPCPCVLVAHERCLLDWIADLEAPSSRRRAGGQTGKILCPQCKSEIKLERPQSVVVNAVRRIERLTGSMLLPGFLFVAATGTVATLTIAGQTAVFQIFGPLDATRILRPRMPDLRGASFSEMMVEYMRMNWRINIGVPLIPAVLVASRTTFADSILPFLPLIFFVSSGRPQDDLLQFSWPPSAAFTIAALPYVRGIYNAYYERVWMPKEQRWLKEVQPRAGTEEGGIAEIRIEDEHIQDILIEEDDVEEEGDIEAVDVEVEVDFDIFADLGDWNNGGAADINHLAENPPVANPLNAPPQDDQDNGMPPRADINHLPQPREPVPAPNIPAQPAAPRRQRVRRERNIAFSTTTIADTILGALVFPTIAAFAGEVLKNVLPKTWVTLPYGVSSKPKGFLQTQWGRSILGGCLFVGMKDAVMLYVRWKMARNHRMRTVLDYDGPKTRTG